MSMLIDPHRFGVAASDPYYTSVALLLHGDGADASTTFTDNAYLTPVGFSVAGNAQISTAQSVFGGASMKFDGAGDYLSRSANVTSFHFDADDFTIEARVRLGATGADQAIVDFRSAFVAEGWSLFVSSANKLTFFAGDANSAGWEVSLESSALSGSTWYAVAVTRVGSTFRLFVDGAVVASATWVGTIAYASGSRTINIGTFFNVSYGPINAHIDEMRITTGVGRYSGTYTPATAAFPNS